MENKTIEKAKSNKKKRTVIIIILLALVLSALVLILIKGQGEAPAAADVLTDEREGITGTYEGLSREEILANLQKNQRLVTDEVSSNVTFKSGKAGSTGEWILQNQEVNTVIQQAELYFGDDNLLIAKTEPVYPGQYIQAVTLLEDLDPGEYKIVAYINYYDVEDKTFAGKAGYRIHMTVKK